MREYTEIIRDRACSLLAGGQVEIFIGYRRGSVPMVNQPVLIRTPEEAEQLHWDSHCALNLCRYLTKRRGRIGVPATGCNARNMVTHILENQIRREQLHILGVPCRGMLDHRAVHRAVDHREILAVEEEGDTFIVRGPGWEKRLARPTLLQQNCRTCVHPNPVIYDELLDDPLPEPEGDAAFRDVEKIEKLAPETRWAFFSRAVSGCIRCYACRNVCPLCYCPTCFVDESRPQWVGKSSDPTDTMTFHLLRAYHCAGRCTDCGACERVCPTGVPVRQFTRKLNKDSLSLFGWEAGMTLEQRPLLDVYRPDDCNDFIR